MKKLYEKLIEVINFSPYWHLEMLIAVPVGILWTVLLFLIWLK
jgi:hypothetical protein